MNKGSSRILKASINRVFLFTEVKSIGYFSISKAWEKSFSCTKEATGEGSFCWRRIECCIQSSRQLGYATHYWNLCKSHSLTDAMWMEWSPSELSYYIPILVLCKLLSINLFLYLFHFLSPPLLFSSSLSISPLFLFLFCLRTFLSGTKPFICRFISFTSSYCSNSLNLSLLVAV